MLLIVLCYCKENGLPHQCAHWFAMTCKRRMRVCGCKNVGRNDMQKTEAFLRLQGGYRFFHRPVITRYTGGSVPLAAPHTAAVRRIFRWPAVMAPTVTL